MTAFLQLKTLMDTKKISWRAQHILAKKATSMKFFRVLSGISLFKKNSSLTQVTDALSKKLVKSSTNLYSRLKLHRQ